MTSPVRNGRLSFVVPFISRQLAGDWGFQNRLLNRTVASVLNQDTDNFCVVIIGHDRPTNLVSDSRVHWVPVSFPLILSECDPQETASPDLEIKWTDRGRKLFRGIEFSRQLGATHVLPVDSDDLVSRRLARLVIENPESNGWVFERGFRYLQGSRFLRYKPGRFFEECGTGTILRIDRIPLPDPIEYHRGYGYYRFLINHSYIAAKMVRQNAPLDVLPFPGAVYVIHGNNFYAKWTRSHPVLRLLDTCKNLAMSRYISSGLTAEFGSFELQGA